MSYDMFGQREMSEAILTLKPVGNFFRSKFFSGAPETHNSDKIDIDVFKGQRRVAVYTRASAKAIPVGRRGFETQNLSLPYIKHSRSLEAAMALLRQPGETIYTNKTPAQRAQEQLVKDLFEIEEMIQRAEELQAAQAILHGLITIKGLVGEETIDAEIDLQRDTDLEFTLGAGETWDDYEVDISSQLREWARLIFSKSGYTPNMLIGGVEALDAFFQNAGVNARLDNRRFNGGSLDTTDSTSPFPGARSYGQFDGFSIWEYNELYVDPADNVEKALVPSKSIALVSPGMKTKAHYGAIKDFGAMIPMKRFVKSIEIQDPSTKELIVQTSPAMINHTPDATALIQVLP